MQTYSNFFSHICTCSLVLLLTGFCRNALASNDIYVCIDAKGTRTYQNTGPTEGCRKLGGEPVLTVPTLPSPPVGAFINTPKNHPQSRNDANQSKGSSGSSRPFNSGETASPTYSDSGAVAREHDRRRILENELRQEEARLQDLQTRFQTTPTPQLQTDIARSNASLDSLRREISKIRK